MKEVGKGGLQDKIITSVIAQGGKAAKTNGAFRKGIADLIIRYPKYPAILAEVKWHGVRKSHNLVSVRLEPLQKKFMNDFGSIALTGMMFNNEVRLYLTSCPSELINPADTPHVPLEHGLFDLRELLQCPYPPMLDVELRAKLLATSSISMDGLQ